MRLIIKKFSKHSATRLRVNARNRTMIFSFRSKKKKKKKKRKKKRNARKKKKKKNRKTVGFAVRDTENRCIQEEMSFDTLITSN
ncbi:hypothetical protein ANTPLA_LOCUS2350 [Anthophora plagiata]